MFFATENIISECSGASGLVLTLIKAGMERSVMTVTLIVDRHYGGPKKATWTPSFRLLLASA